MSKAGGTDPRTVVLEPGLPLSQPLDSSWLLLSTSKLLSEASLAWLTWGVGCSLPCSPGTGLPLPGWGGSRGHY